MPAFDGVGGVVEHSEAEDEVGGDEAVGRANSQNAVEHKPATHIAQASPQASGREDSDSRILPGSGRVGRAHLRHAVGDGERRGADAEPRPDHDGGPAGADADDEHAGESGPAGDDGEGEGDDAGGAGGAFELGM